MKKVIDKLQAFLLLFHIEVRLFYRQLVKDYVNNEVYAYVLAVILVSCIYFIKLTMRS